MTERITILTARGAVLVAKKWLPNGTIEPYGLAKNFSLTRYEVTDIYSLSALLTKLEGKHQSCIIRGGFIGMELATPLMSEVENWSEGSVLRQKEVFKDRALHMFCADVDGYKPVCGMDDPHAAIEEFIALKLPPEFHGVSYHWQLSNSAGHHKHEGVLKAHVWFWLATPQTSADLRAWVLALGKPIDSTVFDPIQVHYTSAPVFEEGVVDPIGQRSGFVEGWMGDSVPLVIEKAAAVVDADEMSNAITNDPVAQRLYDRGLVRGKHGREALNIICPRQEHHSTGETGPTSTMYWPANTGGYKQGNFKCLHDGCQGIPHHKFLDALGFSLADGFTDVEDAGSVSLVASEQPAKSAPTGERKKRARQHVPDALHLCTDQANVQRLLKNFSRNLLVASERWYAWDGMRWVPDDAIATRYAMSLSKIIGQEAQEWAAKVAKDASEDEINKAVVKALKAWATKAEMRSTIDAALALAKRVLVVDSDLLDKDPYLLNCTNGTVDLRTGVMKRHDKDDFITKICPVNYVANSPAPTWNRVLLQVTREEQGVAPVAKFLQRWFGYCATASTREQKFVVHYGMGSNGKSTVLDAVSETLGDYAATAAPGIMMSAGRDRHPTEIADLHGRRMVTAHESGEAGVLREDFVKQATGSDRLKARRMRDDFFEFSPTHKLQLLTNHKPIIKGQDHGIWRRVVLVPYFARFGSPEEVATGQATHVKDISVTEKLRQETEGVLAWLVAGAVEWYRDGLNPPDYVLVASSEYQKEQDRILHFLDETCERDPMHTCYLQEEMGGGLFQVYEQWCKESGFFSLGKLKFIQELERLVPGFDKRPTKVTMLSGRRRDVLQLVGLRLMS